MKKLLWFAVAAAWVVFTYNFPGEGAALLVLFGAYLFGKWVKSRLKRM